MTRYYSEAEKKVLGALWFVGGWTLSAWALLIPGPGAKLLCRREDAQFKQPCMFCHYAKEVSCYSAISAPSQSHCRHGSRMLR